MTIFTYTALRPLVTDLAVANSWGVHHPGTSLSRAASRPTLKWLGWRKVSGLGGGG
jgi:hypothetical protein